MVWQLNELPGLLQNVFGVIGAKRACEAFPLALQKFVRGGDLPLHAQGAQRQQEQLRLVGEGV